MSGHCELCGETGGHSAACVSNPYQAANQRVIIATLTADLARLTAELEKEKAQSRHLAEAMSRKIGELIASENQCSYYKAQYTRAEQTRKEACDANVKAQADMLWAKAELERKQRECEGLREALPRISATLRRGGASLPAPDNDGTIDSAIRTGMSIALCVVEDELAALSAGEKE